MNVAMHSNSNKSAPIRGVVLILLRAWRTLLRDDPRLYNFFLGFFFVLFPCFALLLGFYLSETNRLPSTPLTATNCIDEKLAFLREKDLANITFLAVGSSTTWRNLNLQHLHAQHPKITPLNAAPCYLYMNQTAYFSEFLLSNMPNVKTLVTVVAPRDFESCEPRDTAFVDLINAEKYIFENRTLWYLYVTNMRLGSFIRDIFRIRAMRTDPYSPHAVQMSEFGDGPLRVRTGWLPAPDIDDRCFETLSSLDAFTTAHGVRLIVVSFPTMKEWKHKFDPDGQFVAEFENRIKMNLKNGSSIFISGDGYQVPDEYYADAVHFLWPYTIDFTSFILENMV